MRGSEHSREPDTSVGRCVGDAHPLLCELECFGDALLTLGAIPDGVLHLGAGVVRDDVSVLADMVKNLRVGAGQAGTASAPVAKPAAERIRGHRQISFGVVKRSAQRNRVVQAAARPDGGGDLRGRDRFAVELAQPTGPSRGFNAFCERLVDQVTRIGRCPERDVAVVSAIPGSQRTALTGRTGTTRW